MAGSSNVISFQFPSDAPMLEHVEETIREAIDLLKTRGFGPACTVTVTVKANLKGSANND